MKHTKGQWEVSKSGASVSIKSGDVWIAGIHNQDTMIEGKSIVDKDCYDTSETEANANLIVSAPELLTVCKYALGVLESIPEVYAEQIADILDESIDLGRIENAITKAEGQG